PAEPPPADALPRREPVANHFPASSARPLSVGIGFVVTRDNWAEVVEAAQTARDLGVDSFRISAVFQPDDARYFDGWHDEAKALCQQAESLATGQFRVFNLFGDRLADLRQQRPDHAFCGYQHFT